ncbi:MAG: SusF/SusE family outer membrane protein [Bacteroidaceae bacterium]|nr:SusF/SusE family outer membrane protein [Bacteroidaceae bacterium]
MKHSILSLLLFVLAMHARAELYIVGSAISTNWDRQAMTEQESGVYTWEGYLFHGGELKFMTEASDWGSHWGPSTANALLSLGIQSIALHKSGDYKYRVDNIGRCMVLVDTNTKQIQIADSNGQLPETRHYPPCLYPIGTSVGTTLSDKNDYALHEDTPDAGIYSGLLTLSSGTMALHSKPYKKTITTCPIAPVLAQGASVKLPKLRYSIETDKCCYHPGDTVTLTMSSTPSSGTRVRYRYLGDITQDTLLTTRKWTWVAPPEDFRGYMVEVYRRTTDDGQQTTENGPQTADNILATIGIDVSSDWTHFPRHGFVANFSGDKTLSKAKTEMKWLNRCHINGVQFQDWHYCHDSPFGGTRQDGPWTTYKDIANRTIYTSAVKNYIKAQHDRGMKSIFYNLCYGILDGWENRGVKPEWFLYKDNNHTTKKEVDLPDDWKSSGIYLANPANEEWLAHLAECNDEVYSFLDFDGYQIDQLGGQGTLYDYDGNSVNLREGFATFINYMKNRHPDKRLVMNSVSGWGTSQIAGTGKVDCLYNEVWGCRARSSLTSGEGRFSHIKDVIDENRSASPTLRSVLAAYMNYEAVDQDKDFNTPGVVMADAVMFALGGSHLELGGTHMLCREYFPQGGLNWHSQIEDWMTRYYDFLTAYENLLRDNWTEKTSVKATCSNVTINTWEPVANQVTMLAREVNGRQVIHLLNFTHEETATNVNDDYMLCWHDRDATRPWPKYFENLSIRLTGITGMGRLRRIWVASPDYCGGAMQELTDYRYIQTSGTISLTLPSLQFWTMIVIEPEIATTKDNTIYAPATNGESLVPGITSSLQTSSSSTCTWNLQIEDGIYEAHADIPAGTLTLFKDNDDAIVLPLGEDRGTLYDLTGRPIVNQKPSNGQLRHGIVISKNRKVLR